MVLSVYPHVFLLFYAVITVHGMPDSLKRRIARAQGAPEASEPSSSSTGPMSTGRTSLERRLKRAKPDTAEALPFNEGITSKWASGKISGVGLQDLSERATTQGMPQADHLAQLGGAPTSVRRAFNLIL